MCTMRKRQSAFFSLSLSLVHVHRLLNGKESDGKKKEEGKKKIVYLYVLSKRSTNRKMFRSANRKREENNNNNNLSFVLSLLFLHICLKAVEDDEEGRTSIVY